MAGRDAQKQLLCLIHNFAAEKSQGERRVVTLRKQIEELKSELSAANAELEDAKRSRELVEQELRGCEVQLYLSEASVQTLEARIFQIQDEISGIGSDLETLKNEEGALREQFIKQMFELNSEIRKFQESITCNVDAVDRKAQRDAPQGGVKVNDAEFALSTPENMLARVIVQTSKEEEEYQAEQNDYKKNQQELTDFVKKVSLMDMIINETEALQDLTMQTSKLEAMYSSLGEELQRRCVCPSCHLDNLEVVRELLQENEWN